MEATGVKGETASEVALGRLLRCFRGGEEVRSRARWTGSRCLTIAVFTRDIRNSTYASIGLRDLLNLPWPDWFKTLRY